MRKFVSVLLLAGGTGSRFGAALPKQFTILGSKRIAHYSLDLFLKSPSISEIIIVCDEEFRGYFYGYTDQRIRFAKAGSTRQGSVNEGLKAISPLSEIVCIHDSARPFVSSEALEKVIEEGSLHRAAVLAVPAKNTVKEVNKDGFVKRTLDRSLLWEMQTPQVLSRELLQKGLSYAEQEEIEVTDDVSLAELLGAAVKIVPSSYRNIKITTPDDMTIATSFWQEIHAQV